MASGTESFECENREQGVSQNKKFKLAMCSAFALGMFVGTVGLLAGLGVKAEVSNSALSSALWGTPAKGTVRVTEATLAATKTIRGAETASALGSRPATMTGMEELSEDTVLKASGASYCARRDALAKASAMAAAAIGAPVFAKPATTVKMGGDEGQLVFVPSEITVCKGDKVTWINNKAGPHNVVFNEENVPSGVDAAAISMKGVCDQEGQTYEQTFKTPGTYGYRCEPHAWTSKVRRRRGGMIGTIEVKA
jgi:plastocyanin